MKLRVKYIHGVGFNLDAVKKMTASQFKKQYSDKFGAKTEEVFQELQDAHKEAVEAEKQEKKK